MADLFRLSVRGAGRVARDFDRSQRDIQDEIIRSLRRLGAEAHAILVGHAPEDTGDLIDAIQVVPYYRAAVPRVSIRVEGLEGHGGDPRSYLNVTRYGHRSSRIYPKRARALAVHIDGHGEPPIYRASVTGVSVMSDWVEDADPEIRTAARAEAHRLGRKIEGRVVSSS
jgi:hypothetical protein